MVLACLTLNDPTLENEAIYKAKLLVQVTKMKTANCKEGL